MNAPVRWRTLWHRPGVVMLLAIVTLAGVLVAPSQRAVAVVGGVPISVEQVPWQALVIVEPDNRLCGGSIIDREWIVTAAHCVAGFRGDQIDAHAGITSLSDRTAGNQVQVSEVIVHPSWDASNFRNDIALLRLASAVPVGPTVTSIRLPVGLDAATWPAAGTAASVSGWGADEFGGQPSNQLRQAGIQILGGPGETSCGLYGGNFDAAVEICAGVPAGGVDACQGDSGSPLVIDVAGTPMLAGLTSVGFECGRADYPGIYTRITTFIPWVQQYVPAFTAPPSVPQSVRVEAMAGERLLVQWEPPVSGLQPVAYRAVAQPAGALCQAEATVNSCVIEDVPAGKLVEVVLTSVLPTGTEVSAEPVQAVSVDGVASVDVVIKPRRLARWSGLATRARDDIRLVVQGASRDRCARVGSVADPRGVRAKAPGLCAVRVIVTRPNGKSVRSVAYIGVRAD